MKTLIRDVIAIFTHRPAGPVIIKTELTEEQKAALVPVRSVSVGWVTSVAELKKEVIREARKQNAAGYKISDLVRSRFVHARATFYV